MSIRFTWGSFLLARARRLEIKAFHLKRRAEKIFASVKGQK